MQQDQHETAVTETFHQWALAGRGEGMARSHADIVEQALASWSLGGARVLDLGCGVGGALTQALAAGANQVAGIDLVAEMVRRGREHLPQADLQVGSVEALPWTDGSFTHVLSVESAYYWSEPARALAEAHRVLAQGGALGILIELYGDNPGAHAWPAALGLDLHVWSAQQWAEALEQAGFSAVQTARVVSRSPVTPRKRFEPSAYFDSYADYLTYRREGALWVTATR